MLQSGTSAAAPQAQKAPWRRILHPSSSNTLCHVRAKNLWLLNYHCWELRPHNCIATPATCTMQKTATIIQPPFWSSADHHDSTRVHVARLTELYVWVPEKLWPYLVCYNSGLCLDSNTEWPKVHSGKGFHSYLQMKVDYLFWLLYFAQVPWFLTDRCKLVFRDTSHSRLDLDTSWHFKKDPSALWWNPHKTNLPWVDGNHPYVGMQKNSQALNGYSSQPQFGDNY